VPGRVRRSSRLARFLAADPAAPRSQSAVRRCRPLQGILIVSSNAARSLISRCRPRLAAARPRRTAQGRAMTRAADPLRAAIRVWPLTVMMMVREVITESGRHPDRCVARPLPNESASLRRLRIGCSSAHRTPCSVSPVATVTESAVLSSGAQCQSRHEGVMRTHHGPDCQRWLAV